VYDVFVVGCRPSHTVYDVFVVVVAAEVGDDLPGQRVFVRELDDVLFRDVGNKIKDSGK
jgi:hypothetical protein